MTIATEIVGPILSGGIVGIMAWIGVKVSVARLEERHANWQTTVADRLTNIEKSIGIRNGDAAAFVRIGECEMASKAAAHRFQEMGERIDRLESRTHSAADG